MPEPEDRQGDADDRRIIVQRATRDLGFTPDATPSGMPISSQITAAPAAIIAVTGSRRMISSRTGMKLENE